jgi:hypothetical protein
MVAKGQNRTCGWRIDTEAGNGQIRETRCDEELQLRMISLRVFAHVDLHIAASATL